MIIIWIILHISTEAENDYFLFVRQQDLNNSRHVGSHQNAFFQGSFICCDNINIPRGGIVLSIKEIVRGDGQPSSKGDKEGECQKRVLSFARSLQSWHSSSSCDRSRKSWRQGALILGMIGHKDQTFWLARRRCEQKQLHTEEIIAPRKCFDNTCMTKSMESLLQKIMKMYPLLSNNEGVLPAHRKLPQHEVVARRSGMEWLKVMLVTSKELFCTRHFTQRVTILHLLHFPALTVGQLSAV